MIPKTFIRKYGENLSSLTFLKLPNGAKWKVELTYYLWRTDAAPEVPHLRLTWREATARASGRVPPCHNTWLFFFKADSRRLAPTRLLLRSIRAESGRNGRFRSKFKKKKKKKVQNAPFELNLKPSFSSLHTNTPNFLY